MSREKDTKRSGKSRTTSGSKSGKTRKTKPKKLKFSQKHPRFVTIMKLLFLIIFLLLIIAAGIAVGTLSGSFGDDLKITKESLQVEFENSEVYDIDGNLIATLSGGTKRKSISLAEMNPHLPQAYVAIEDERFYEHSGVDFQRTLYATFTYITHGGNSSFGGSTITQQVIKNITQEKDDSGMAGVTRKIKEMSKAIQVEQYLSKDQILELYLNLIYVGGDDVNGVELGSIYYFDKSAKDLTLAECAYLAGINHSPSAYKPYADFADKENPEEERQKMAEKIKNRTKTVLKKMEEVGYISAEEKEQAYAEVDAGLPFKKGDAASISTDMSYHTAAAIEQILDQMMEQNEDLKRDVAEMMLYSGGYKIYTTQKSDIQARVEEELVKDKYITTQTYKDKDGNKQTEYSMPTMVIIDNSNGYVVAAASATGPKGNREVRTKLGYFNIPTRLRKQTGSSMKPIAVTCPGLESGTINAATVYDDDKTTFADGWTPKEWYTGYKGLLTMRTAIEVSANIPHAKALSDIGLNKSVKYCESVGLPKFDNEGLSLALGGLSKGATVSEMCGAYSAIANKGVFNEPTYFIKVEDSKGNIAFEPSRVTERRVLSEANAYIVASILTQPVVGPNGTAKYCAIKGMTTCAKTGTTNGDNDRWLSGFTPYYTASVWYGYEFSATVHYSGTNPAGLIWSSVMKDIHTDLPNATYTEPAGIVHRTVCRLSGQLAGPGCAGTAYDEIFTPDNVPTSTCPGHGSAAVCTQTGLLAGPFCPQEVRGFAGTPEHEQTTKWKTETTYTSLPTETCTVHGAGSDPNFVNQILQKQYEDAMQFGTPEQQAEARRALEAARAQQQQTP